MAAFLSVLKQQAYRFYTGPKVPPRRSNLFFFPVGAHVKKMDVSLQKKNSDDNVVITLEALNSGDVFMCQHIDSEVGVWSTVESKAHLYYPEYQEGELVQVYCHEKEFWGDYFVKRKNKIWCATKGSNCQYAPTYTLHAVTDPNDVVANQSVSRQVAAYDMRSQE